MYLCSSCDGIKYLIYTKGGCTTYLVYSSIFDYLRAVVYKLSSSIPGSTDEGVYLKLAYNSIFAYLRAGEPAAP